MNSLTVTATIALRLAELMSQNQQLELDVRALAVQVAEVRDEEQQADLKKRLSSTLAKQFDTQQNMRELEVEQIEARLQKLRELISRRAESRRRIIEHRLEQVLNDAEGLGYSAAAGGEPLSSTGALPTTTTISVPGKDGPTTAAIDFQAESPRTATTLDRPTPTDISQDNMRMAHLMALPTQGEMQWRWKVTMPKGTRRYEVCAATRGIPENGFAKNYTATAIEIDEGEQLLTAEVQASPEGGPQLAVTWGKAKCVFRIAPEDARWFLTEKRGYAAMCVGTHDGEDCDPNKPIVLLQVRAMQPDGPGVSSVSADSPPGEGLMIWIKKPQD